MQSFYLLAGDTKTGPFDLSSMVKRIKNGKLLPTDLVCIDENPEPVAANHIPVFHEYFIEIEYQTDLSKPEAMYPKAPPIAARAAFGGSADTIAELLSYGWEELVEHQRSAIIVALGIAGTLILGLGLNNLLGGFGAAIVSGALIGMLLHLFYLDCALLANGENGGAFLRHLKQPALRSLLAAGAAAGAVCIGLPIALWSAAGPVSLILLLLGGLAFGLTLAAPQLWLQMPQNAGASCMIASVKQLISAPKTLLLRAMMLQGIVVFLGLLLIFPLVIVLPVVTFAWHRLMDDASA